MLVSIESCQYPSARERVRRHVQRVRCRGRDLGVAARGFDRLGRERRDVVGVNDVVHEAGMIGLGRCQPFEDRARLQQVGVGPVGRIVGRHERHGVEGRSLGIIGVLGGEAGHRVAIGAKPRRLVDLLEIGKQPAGGGNVVALTFGPGADRVRFADRRAPGLEQRWRLDAGRKGIPPLAERDAPLRDGASGIRLLGRREALDRRSELERVQKSHGARKRRLGGRRARSDKPNGTQLLGTGVLMVLRPGGRGRGE